MFGLSPFEVIVILLIAVLLFGKRLPEIGSSLGKAILNFRNSSKSTTYDNKNSKIDFKVEDSSDDKIIESENINNKN